MKKILLCISALLFTCLSSIAENTHHFYINYSSKDGLPGAGILSCCQDDFGRIWIGTNERVFYYSGSRFTPLLNKTYIENSSLITNAIVKDQDNNIWIGSLSGVGYYDITNDSYNNIEELKGVNVYDIDIGENGQIWITSAKGLWVYSKETNTARNIKDTSLFSPFRSCVSENQNIVFTANNNCIYIYSPTSDNLIVVKAGDASTKLGYIDYIGGNKVLVSDGLKKVYITDISNGESELIVDSNIIENQAEVNCLMYKAGQCWIGTAYGLVIYDKISGQIERQFPDNLDQYALGGENIRCLASDKSGNVWAGTFKGGLRCWMSFEEGFERHIANEGENSLIGNTVRSLESDNNGNLYIGSEEGYLCVYNQNTKTFTDLTNYSDIAYGTAITDLLLDGQTLWIATYGDGIIAFDVDNKRVIKKYDLERNDCLTLLKASDSNIYIGTAAGMFIYNRASDSFEILKEIENIFIHSLVETNDGELLIGSFSHGLSSYNLTSKQYQINNNVPSNLSITCLHLDAENILWIGTVGSGLYRFDYSELGEITHFDTKSNFPSNTISSILEDDNNVLWISTSNGLVAFDKELLKISKTYLQNDDIIGSQFAYASSTTTTNGLFCFGTNAGLLIFNPEYIVEKFKDNPIIITNIGLLSDYDRSKPEQEGKSVVCTNELWISEKDATYLTVSFSDMNYGSPNINSYDCTLSSNRFNNKLTTINQHITYTNLKPGRYEFRVNYFDSQNKDTEAIMRLVIYAPWYRSFVAIMFYIVICLGIALLVLRKLTIEKEEKNKRKAELIQTTKEKHIVHEKFELLTNIAHEVRTPVSVIQIILDKITTENKVPDTMSNEFYSIKLNVDNLYKLCSELLDFRKIENGQHMLIFADEDVTTIGKNVIKTFETAAKNKNIKIVVSIPNKAIIANCDDSAIESILSNLMSNAIKYCKSKILFSINSFDDTIIMKMKNDGERIADEESESIFNAFYQIHSKKGTGSGLGLTYSKKIAELHHGKLYFDKSEKVLNSFVLEIPGKLPEIVEEINSEIANSDISENIYDLDQKPTILVVEDNDSMRSLIKDELSKDYNILEAYDGLEALDIVKEGHTDLVVSDIMMPKMDGCQMCNEIKENIQLSHIPVLLLTAAVGIETHIKSLKSGADAYIEKPFKMEFLRENINALFRNRDIRNKQFSTSPLAHISCSSISKIEQDFVAKLHSYIMDNLAQTNLTITTISAAMNITKTTLSRKVKANLGLTVNEYVRICRLKKAAELLSENNYRINEVAYLVGYSSPSYFTASFQKQFNKLPSDFIKNS